MNLAYELGEQEGKQGAEMVRKVLKDNFDLDIKYYALVDFQAFATAIDTLFPDGVTIDAQFSTLNGVPVKEATVGDDLHATETESPTQTIKVGTQQMNGSTLLNYARFRDDDERRLWSYQETAASADSSSSANQRSNQALYRLRGTWQGLRNDLNECSL